MTKPKRQAVYARVSTNMQSTGLEAQVRVLKEYCERQDITNYEMFLDENQSGTKASRPALDRMMSAIRNGEISSIIVYSFSRFARSTTHLLTALEEFKRLGVGFVSLTDKIDTATPVGVAVFSILAAVSQLERDLIAERVKNGLANARAKGRHIGRKKTRPSELIRALLKSGMTYRAAAEVAQVSHGSIHAEKIAMKREEANALGSLETKESKAGTPVDVPSVPNTVGLILPGPGEGTSSPILAPSILIS